MEVTSSMPAFGQGKPGAISGFTICDVDRNVFEDICRPEMLTICQQHVAKQQL